jgi:hypothetical protein
MNQPLQSIVQHLFQVSSLDDVSRQRLEAFVEEHPAFGIGHYLLSHKLRTGDPERYRETTQRTSLYFSNPFWLQWQLENPDSGALRLDTDGLTGEVPLAEAPESTSGESLAEAPVQAGNESFAETPEPIAEAYLTEASEPGPEEMREETQEAPIGQSADPEQISAADRLLLSIEEAKGLRESLHKINEDFAADGVPQEQPILDQEAAFVLDEPEEATAPAPESTPASTDATLSAPIASDATTAPVASDATTAPVASDAATAPATPDLVFEPYHTIDYFASQGIKLTLEENPGDTLGKQLKSFTDWLKVMRRLPQKDRESSVPDRVAEQAVQSFAAHSIQSKDIVTETMAEVLIKQGMRDRARTIYEKLSLLNPDKKAYFAAKIEQLNIP